MAKNLETKEFWDSIENYEDYTKKVKSIFENNNELIKLLKNIKNKDKKIIADIGCGVGKAIEYIKKFKKIYEVDFSLNMLNISKNKNKEFKNIEYLKQNIQKLNLPKKVDLILAVSSIMPENYNEIDIIFQSLKKNIKKNGTIILTLPSLEAETFLLQIFNDYEFKQGLNTAQIQKNMYYRMNTLNFTPLGYINLSGKIQKHWIKEEIKFRLKKFNFKKIEIIKLNLDWEIQMKKKELEDYPKIWQWIIIIKN